MNTDAQTSLNHKENRPVPGRRLILSLWLICAILGCMVLIAPRAASPDNPLNSAMNRSIDGKIVTALELAAGSSAASLAVSALPGDTATPIAEKLADFSGGFLLVLCALYFEKSMFSVVGFALFMILFPVMFLLLLISLYRDSRFLKKMAVFLGISGVLIGLMLPSSLFVSDMVYRTQQSLIQETIASAGDLSLEIEEGEIDESASDTDGIAENRGAGIAGTPESGNLIQRIFTNVSSFSAEMVRKAKRLITGFLQSLALMIVTACVIPVAVMLFFAWLIRLVFQVCFNLGVHEAPGFQPLTRA